MNTQKLIKTFAMSAFAVAISFGSMQALAGVGHGKDQGHAKNMNIGKPGNPNKIDRTVEIKMFDNYFEEKMLSVKEGETVRFVVMNAGEFVHEFNIGTKKMHLGHQAEMMKMMENGVLESDKINHQKMMMGKKGKSMAHKDPNSVLLEPQKTGVVIWKFAKAGKIEFACNVPGHYEDGMKGRVMFNERPSIGS